MSTDQDVGEQMVTQLFSNPSVMLLSAAVLGLLGLVPGMPNLVFLMFTAALLGLAWWMRGREQKAPEEAQPVKKMCIRDRCYYRPVLRLIKQAR